MPWPWRLLSRHGGQARQDADEAREAVERARREREEALALARELEEIRNANGIAAKVHEAFRARPGDQHG